MAVTIDDEGQLLSVRGDTENELTAGFACSKGVDSAEMHNRPDRILKPLRCIDGRLVEITMDQATQEISDKLATIIDRNGPEAVALYSGTASFFNTSLYKVLAPFMQAIGSSKIFTPVTIDNSSALVRAARMGAWGAGKQRFETSDVWISFGHNPLVSPRKTGPSAFNPMKKIKAAKKRGMQLILIDPRRTETAQYADQFLQVKPGEDVSIASAMLRIILDEGLYDAQFCGQFVDGLEILRKAVDPFTPELASKLAGVSPEQVQSAARTFAGPGKKGVADIGTGITMQPFSNLADHMIELLNVVCGRYLRAGASDARLGPLRPYSDIYAEVVRPARWWETSPKLRAGNYGMLFTENGGEFPTTALPDEILLPGKGQIKALLCIGGNPAAAIPDQTKVAEAFKSLELLVSVEPFMTATARLSHYVVPPKLMFERPDLPLIWGSSQQCVPFVQYTPAITKPPAGSEVVEEAHFIWDLARRMGKTIVVDGQALDMERPPSPEDILDRATKGSQIPLAEIKRHPHGILLEMEQTVLPARPEQTKRFDIMPDDVVDELARYLAAPRLEGEFTHRLTVRRLRHAMNSLVSAPEKLSPKKRYNPAYMHSSELVKLGLKDGDRMEIIAEAGTIVGRVEADDSLRPGLVSMSHMWGGLPGDPADEFGGACTSRLVSTREKQSINAMPAMTSIPVRLRPLDTVAGN